MARNELSSIQEEFPEDAVFIIGAGHFGSRAARMMSQRPDSATFVLDLDESRLSRVEGLPVKTILCDGVLFLVRNFHLLNPSNTIVPAIPVHLAYEWLEGYLDPDCQLTQIPLPRKIQALLPHTWPGSEGSLLVSYADFLCPDDCPEPDVCTVTGEKREKPMYALLGRLDLLGFRVHIIRSHQLAPGLGGYTVADLKSAAETFARHKKGKWLLGTACKCHGILTALEVRSALGNERRKG